MFQFPVINRIFVGCSSVKFWDSDSCCGDCFGTFSSVGYERLFLAQFTIYLIFQVDLGSYCEREALPRDSRSLVF